MKLFLYDRLRVIGYYDHIIHWQVSFTIPICFSDNVISTYRYESIGNGSSVKMHRTVSSEDVKKYSSGARVKDMQLEKEEDIEYRSGHLYHSSGSTTVKLVKPQQRFTGRHATLQEGPLNEGLFSANGSYALDLLRCYRVASTARRGRRSAIKPMLKGSLEVVVDRGNFSLCFETTTCVYQGKFVYITHIILSLHMQVLLLRLRWKTFVKPCHLFHMFWGNCILTLTTINLVCFRVLLHSYVYKHTISFQCR